MGDEKHIDVKDANGKLSKLRMIEGKIRTNYVDEGPGSIPSGLHTLVNEHGESVSKFGDGTYRAHRSGKTYWPA